MQEKRTLYLAGKITGDPYYFTKFYNAQKKLEECGFIVVNPALLPAEGFTWEAYMRMSGAMLAECAEVCFLPDWKESKGAKYEFGEAMAQNKPFFFFADWEKAQEETNKYEYTTEKTDKILQILRRRIKGAWLRKENGGITKCGRINFPFRRKRKSK